MYFRWYYETYDLFTLESSASNYVLHLSAAGSGDAGDAFNLQTSPANGAAFSSAYTACNSLYGYFWYTSYNLCCFVRFFGKYGQGFTWESHSLQILLMMVQQLN